MKLLAAKGSLGGGLAIACEPIDIFGLSRGGPYAVLFAQELEKRGVHSIRFVGVIDAVSTGIKKVGPTKNKMELPNIVKAGLHAIKDPPEEVIFLSDVPAAQGPITLMHYMGLPSMLVAAYTPIDFTTHLIKGNIKDKYYKLALNRTVKPSRHQLMGVDENVRNDLKKAASDAGVKWLDKPVYPPQKLLKFN